MNVSMTRVASAVCHRSVAPSIAVLFAMLLAWAPSPGMAQGEPMPDTAGWLRLRLFGDRFSILMPPGWEVLPTEEPNTRVRIASTQPASPERPGTASCNVKSAAAEATTGMTQAALDVHVLAKPLSEAAARRSLGVMTGTEIRENAIGRVGSHPARMVVGAGEARGARGRVGVVVVQATLLRPGGVLVVTCRATDRTREGAEAAWLAWRATLIGVVGSLNVEE